MCEKKKTKEAKIIHALIVFAILILCMAISIIKYDVGVHSAMFIGVILAAAMALFLGYEWTAIENSMKDGIYNALPSIMILMIVGILVGVWVVGGVVPSMIYYGLKILSPSIFLFAALLVTSITALATGTSWGSMGTMGLALMGIGIGLGIPAPMCAGPIISGAYFGDKMSPLSDTTNLAPAMAGTDVMTHIKFMMFPTGIAYGISCIVFLVMGFSFASGNADMSAVDEMSSALCEVFNINPFLLLPPIIVIVAIACKVPAIPGIILGILSGAIIGPICQGADCNFGMLLDAGYNGFTCESGNAAIDDLLTTGGINNMLYSVSLTMIAMMFGGIMEHTGMLEALVRKIMKLAKTPALMVLATEVTCILSNATMPEQYISIVVPGRMYAQSYEDMDLDPRTLSNALESSGTVTSALVPWNTCGVFILATLGVHTSEYFMYAVFNWLMPIVTVVLAFVGITLYHKDGYRLTKKQKKLHAQKQD